MKVLEITFFLLILCIGIFLLYLGNKLGGDSNDDEMFKFFLNKALVNVGSILLMIAIISTFYDYIVLITYSGNIPIEVMREKFITDFKYVIIGLFTYLWNVIKFKLILIRNKNREEE